MYAVLLEMQGTMEHSAEIEEIEGETSSPYSPIPQTALQSQGILALATRLGYLTTILQPISTDSSTLADDHGRHIPMLQQHIVR